MDLHPPLFSNVDYLIKHGEVLIISSRTLET